MKHKPLWQGVCTTLGMLVLILDGKTALRGAQAGIELCLKTVVPSLFPFFLLSILLTDSLTGISFPLLRPLTRVCGVPDGTESLLLSGFLGGYPVGAQCVCAAYRSGHLSARDAERMLAFCNNAGPAFLFGMISSVFPGQAYIWALWVIHILSALLTAWSLPGKPAKIRTLSPKKSITISLALQASIRVMATVCGWVILFRVIIAFLRRWFLWLLPVEMQVLVTGLLELSNGCCELHTVTGINLRFLICSVFLAFGGVCVTMQTVSVTSGLSLRYYFSGKVMQALFSLILSMGILYNAWPICLSVLTGSAWLFRKMQKKSSIPEAVGV